MIICNRDAEIKKSEIPNCSSFKTVREAVKTGPLVVARLEVYVFVSGLIETFPDYVSYQNNFVYCIFKRRRIA